MICKNPENFTDTRIGQAVDCRAFPFHFHAEDDVKIQTFLLTLIVSSGLVACGGGDSAPAGEPAHVMEERPLAGGGFVNLTPAELQEMLMEKDFPLINVHIPFEGDLPDTDLSIAFDEIAQHLDQLPADRDAKIVLYCRSGSMSAEAAEVLVGLGYTQVYHLDGGFRAWAAEGLPLIGGGS